MNFLIQNIGLEVKVINDFAKHVVTTQVASPLAHISRLS